ncbi:MAG: ACP phosphodiesterase [Bacteroidota bacterium]
MNFLAHLFLSCKNEGLLIGNMIADFIRNKEVEQYSEDIQKGIFLHRQIDSYTDNHPLVRQGTRRLIPRHRKYAPVVIDIFYDYLLANNWERYSDVSLQEFADATYATLNKHIDLMPPRLRKRLPVMIEGNWLVAYGGRSGLQFTFEKMEQRTRFPSQFSTAMNDLMADLSLYEEEFNQFFPDVIGFVNEQCKA